MKKYLIIWALSVFTLTSCGGGGSGGGASIASGGGIPQPGNLTTSTTSIVNAGNVPVIITNTGQSPVSINESKLQQSSTKDKIQSNDCSGKTLNAGQTCKIIINVQHDEVGKDEIDLDTNNGKYVFPIVINTKTNGLTSNTTTISVAGSFPVLFTNAGVLPLTISNGSITNTATMDTIDLEHTDCFNKQLSTNQSCTVTLNVYHNEKGKDDITLSTNAGAYSFPIAIDTESSGLISLTNNITSGGNVPIMIKNNGRLPITISNGSMAIINTIDKIDLEHTDCFGKTLNQNQTCNVMLNIVRGEAGQDTLKLNTSTGEYYFTVGIDTTDGGVLSTNKNDIETTKPQIVSIINNGVAPLLVKSFSLESGNTTLKATNVSCINKNLDMGKSCQIQVQASPGQIKRHFLTVVTNNTFLKQKPLLLNEKTNVNSLALNFGNASVKTIQLKNPGAYNFIVANNGTNDINISKLSLSNASVGSISTTCNNVKLQAGDTCNVTINAKDNAYGSANLVADTAEKLETAFNYPVNVDHSDLAIDSSHDVVLHPNATKSFTVHNNGAFAIDLNSIGYDTSVMTLSTNCTGRIPAGGNCTGTIHGIKTIDTTTLNFHEFGGNVNQQINVHITNGVAVAFQPIGNNYYKLLPRDGNFYQVFTVTNNSNDTQTINVTNRDSEAVTVMTPDVLGSGAFLQPNCATKRDSGSVAAHSTCELVVREPNNLGVLQQIINDGSNPDKGNLRVQVTYTNTNDIFIQKYQGNVETKQMHRNQIYPNGSSIHAVVPIINNPCGITPHFATAYVNVRHCDPNTMCSMWSEGMVLKADLRDANTIHAVYFAGATFNGSNTCFINADIPVSLNHFSSNTKYYDRDFGGGAYFSAFGLAGSGCDGYWCNFGWAGGNARNDYERDKTGLVYVGKFLRPLPAADWTIATGVSWQDLGAVTLRSGM